MVKKVSITVKFANSEHSSIYLNLSHTSNRFNDSQTRNIEWTSAHSNFRITRTFFLVPNVFKRRNFFYKLCPHFPNAFVAIDDHKTYKQRNDVYKGDFSQMSMWWNTLDSTLFFYTVIHFTPHRACGEHLSSLIWLKLNIYAMRCTYLDHTVFSCLQRHAAANLLLMYRNANKVLCFHIYGFQKT